MDTPPPNPEPIPPSEPQPSQAATSQAAPPPANRLSNDDKLWIYASHLSLLLGLGLIVPLVIYLVKKDDSPLITEHAREALNFHISVYIYSIVCFILFVILIGMLLLPALIIGAVVLAIIAAIKASEGTLYRYPLTIRLVK